MDAFNLGGGGGGGVGLLGLTSLIRQDISTPSVYGHSFSPPSLVYNYTYIWSNSKNDEVA